MPEIIVKLGDNVVHKYFLYKDVVTIGRAPDNEISIENLAVSRRHVVIRCIEGRYYIEDNNSANGSYVNGVRISKTEILDKDIITVGKHKLHFYNQQMAVPQAELSQATMLVAPPSTKSATLRVVQGKQAGESFKIDSVEMTIGRAADNDVRLNDWFVSKHHALVVRKGTIFYIRDLASWRHTLVNGVVVQEQALKANDQIQFGPKTTVVFELRSAAGGAAPDGRIPVELSSPEEASRKADSTKVDSVMAEIQSNESDQPVETNGASAPEDEEPKTTVLPLDAVHGPPVEPANSEPESEPQSEAAPGDDESGWSRFVSNDIFETAEVDPHQNVHQIQPVELNVSEGAEEMLAEEQASCEDADRPDEALEDRAADGSDEFEEQATDEPDKAAGDDEEERVEAAAREMTDDISSVATELSGADAEEVAMWLKALQNSSKVIRKQAQRKLKVLTGREYDIELE